MDSVIYEKKAEKRTQAYEAFRKFSHDPNQKGETLNSVSPPTLSATKSLIAKRAFITRMAYKPNAKIGANSLLIPTELLWGSGYIPFNWEMFSSLIASHSRVIEVTNKGSAPVPRCSFINSLKGACIEEILPVPDVILSSSAFCEGIGHILSEVSDEFKVPHLHIDIPGYFDESSSLYLASQLKDIFKTLCKVNNIDIDEGYKRLKQSFYHANRAKIEYMKIFELRREYAPINLGMEPLHWHGQFLPNWGDESGYTICKRLKDEIIEVANNSDSNHDKENLPLSMFGLIPYGRSEVWKQLKEANVSFVFEGVNYLGKPVLVKSSDVEKMNIDDVFRHLSYNLINAPVRGLDFRDKADDFIRKSRDAGAKGIIIFSHEHCQMLAARLNEYENTATKYGLKFVTISGDCILGMPKGPTGLRLGTFLNELKNQDKKSKERINFRASEPTNGKDVSEVRVGIDFGSGFSKFMAIDKNNKVLQKGLFTSGIDYPHLLNDIKSKLSGHEDISYALAGVGSDNDALRDMVDKQTTEINALIKGVRTICHELDSYLVVDIGTQDVKVLKFYADKDTPWINTNKSCGAGTGMVLVQILERWKQSKPNLTFDDLDRMAGETTKSELINTTCGIFAVTNVVSALIQSDENRKRDILRGVYHYIATQAIKLLPPEENTNIPLLLAGGVGNHNTLKEIFVEKGFELLPLPDSIPHQHLIAYGTALSLNDHGNF